MGSAVGGSVGGGVREKVWEWAEGGQRGRGCKEEVVGGEGVKGRGKGLVGRLFKPSYTRCTLCYVWGEYIPPPTLPYAYPEPHTALPSPHSSSPPP